jgi:hypothetical protein
MTIDEFLEALSKTQLTFSVNAGYIRSNDKLSMCPIEAVSNKRGTLQAVEALGLSYGDGSKIVCAADNLSTLWSFDPELRQKLLDALNLVELPSKGNVNG